mmetsp:Transcript_15431/g.31258  ORF Transcript_15431/g.31258 Transcript_15431/m.31258 type:complete len:104 (-) Transcript_15431:403-714(-)
MILCVRRYAWFDTSDDPRETQDEVWLAPSIAWISRSSSVALKVILPDLIAFAVYAVPSRCTLLIAVKISHSTNSFLLMLSRESASEREFDGLQCPPVLPDSFS